MILSELHGLILIKWGWMLWLLLHLWVSDSLCLFTVHQPHVVTAALGQDVILPCQLQSSHDDKMVHPPVLYWEYSSHPSNPKLWPHAEAYKGRVSLLDNNSHSSNKSLLFKHVQWSDSGKYLCKLTINTADKSFRKKGNETLLIVHDTMTFNLTNRSSSRLQCEVNVSGEAGSSLSILHNGSTLATVASARGDALADSPHVTLSESASLRGVGTYECRLHVNEELVTKRVFHFHLPVPGEVQGNVTATCPSVLSGLLLVSPEPWLLYLALLLVPITFLLGIVTARLLRKS